VKAKVKVKVKAAYRQIADLPFAAAPKKAVTYFVMLFFDLVLSPIAFSGRFVKTRLKKSTRNIFFFNAVSDCFFFGLRQMHITFIICFSLGPLAMPKEGPRFRSGGRYPLWGSDACDAGRRSF
jgi:hypothetical protein